MTEAEFDRASDGLRSLVDLVNDAYNDFVDGYYGCEGFEKKTAAASLFGAPGAAEITAGLLSLEEGRDVGGVRDLLSMWQALTPARRSGLLAYAADQERLSKLDRRDSEPGRFDVEVTVRNR